MDKIPANSRDRNGFTLVEMMVALFIFAMLSVAGVIMLRSAVDSDEITAENLGQMAEMQRFVSLMEADLSQALPRTHRDDRGDRMPAFASESGGAEAAFLKFTRGGQSNINGQARSNLERVEYRLRDGNLERWRYRMTDGGSIDQPAVLISNVDTLEVRFRDKRGLWSGRWETERLADLPRAIEIQFDQQGRRYRHLFLVGTGYL
ncbi:type II secretion system minor pseudopilin GspJ [Sphingorhabdus sp. YGSMI21]|uniref:type II secretion system minor pseudopilin GspJ n=1 Tax=Sphingorhabdus sp. YGSMI21 TaxID=2077182 RepID=UPI000C1F0DF3|nr:type II secretion system minor pseudopilin GspJ [Sphingorhabdus sp. YGSMI21]ATW05172.1 type II secretion system protein GspJ [Sphingorhabdus sp. YGSMI21]